MSEWTRSVAALVLVGAAILGGCVSAEKPDKASSADATADAAEVAENPADTAVDDSAADSVALDTADPPGDGKGADAAKADTSGPCTPQCKGKVCGPNGCGSVCGFCKSGEFCAEDGSACKGFCEKQCAGKICGPDGCGGQCGTCDGDKQCAADGNCYTPDCKGSCTGKQCGDNGCGKSCGSCGAGDFCDVDQCKASPCKGIDPQKGSCEGDILLTCSGSGATAQKIAKNCAAPPNLNNLTCGWDAIKNSHTCVVKQCDSACVTDTGKKMVCGTNGCGEPCGTCPDGWKCDVTACNPVAGGSCSATTFPAQGQCSGDTWIYCNGGKLSFVKCLDVGAVKCGWDGSAGKFACIY
jgi:outer membrane murein-binding lipoprotein Lpp